MLAASTNLVRSLGANQNVFIYGRCTNRTEPGYIMVQAGTLHMIHFSPFEFTIYDSKEIFF